MLGTLRLLLALTVVASHAGWRPFGLRIGVSAVIVFYLISGYAMSGLAPRFLAVPGGAGWAGAAAFWRDRALRLYPQFLLWTCVAAAVVFGLHRRWMFQTGEFGWVAALGNFTMVPLGLYMFIPSLGAMMLLPQGWSLSTEFGFYALFPALVRSRPAAFIAAAFGLGVLAFACAGRLQPEWYGCRLLPGSLPFFLAGRALYCRDTALGLLVTAGLAAVASYTAATGHLGLGYSREILAAALAGPPLLLLAVRLPAWRFDAVAGHISYGAYLAHIAILTGLLHNVKPLAVRAPAACVLATVAGFLSWRIVEVPVNRFRHRLRTVPVLQAADWAREEVALT